MWNKKYKDLNYFDLTPYHLYDCEKTDEGLINVLVPKFTDKIFGKLLQPRIKNKYIRANLDKIGSETWLLIDGNNKVFEIADKLQIIFGNEINQVNDRLLSFLSNLFKNGFISFKEFNK